MNVTTICGNLGQDPEIKTTQGERKVARFSVATTRSYKKKGSEDWQEDTQWHTVIAWDHLANKVERHLKKGSKVTIKGEYRSRKYRPANADNDVTVWELIADYIEPAILVRSADSGGSFPTSEPPNTSIGMSQGDEPPTDDLPF